MLIGQVFRMLIEILQDLLVFLLVGICNPDLE
ncbi:hypothetical protein FHT21_005002 [Pedobacter sp. SG908]|nr:hypothetical protein [Pedobacter sp. SG908]NMN39210.1 hypothetical protein [Pedobacter sp. SG918]